MAKKDRDYTFEHPEIESTVNKRLRFKPNDFRIANAKRWDSDTLSQVGPQNFLGFKIET